jgi:diadenosine tetraphosphatase ApaH/serine/threonine PP2A family protein phosphatase
MKHAFLCCIHGNFVALEAVAADIGRSAPDRVWCLGDVIGYGAQPRECLDFVMGRGWPTLLGNHEQMVLDQSKLEEFNPLPRYVIYFTLGAIGEHHRAWMRTLPEMIEEPGFQLVHGAPYGNKSREYLMNADNAKTGFAAATRPLVFHGHTHICKTFHFGDPIEYSKEPKQRVAPGARAIVDVGSVGQPRDSDPRASWVLYDDRSGEIEYHRVVYDNAEAARRHRAAGLPEKLAERLISAR